jgi:hypothetical protein
MARDILAPSGGARPEHVFARAFVWRVRCAEVLECLWTVVEGQPALFSPEQHSRIAALRQDLAQREPEQPVGEVGSAVKRNVVGADGLTARERRAWSVEQVAEATLNLVGLAVADDLHAGPGDGMHLNYFWQLDPERRAGALAAMEALGHLFEGFALIAPQPTFLAIGAPVDVFVFSAVGLRRTRLVAERQDGDDTSAR